MRKLYPMYASLNKVYHWFDEKYRYYSLCGVGAPWYKPNHWQKDKEGLALRRECKKCAKIKVHYHI